MGVIYPGLWDAFNKLMYFFSNCLDCEWRDWFSFSFLFLVVVVVFLILDGLQFLKHAAFEEGMANQRGLTLLWSNSKGFPRLTITAPCLRQCQNTKQAWPPTFLSPALTIHTCHRTVTLNCFQSLIYCYLKNNPSDQVHTAAHLFPTTVSSTVLFCHRENKSKIVIGLL